MFTSSNKYTTSFFQYFYPIDTHGFTRGYLYMKNATQKPSQLRPRMEQLTFKIVSPDNRHAVIHLPLYEVLHPSYWLGLRVMS
jgi:hypothetical protein